MPPDDQAEKPAITPEQVAKELKEFQKLAKYADRKAYWNSHEAIKQVVSEANFHA